ncbi:unnamed protein product [Rotaria sp. Silwood1]|nr:unnamed protein product [Rotaria sp. Silwood1]CAF4692072.1 unnamed protein product [Rotaria sp. Silwood1]CAF4794757.1 unnamed protein product [Rotaria sp. Silwood1]
MSILSSLSPAEHLLIGKALAPLRNENVLIIGSGSTIHGFKEDEGQSSQFGDALIRAMTECDEHEREHILLNWEQMLPHARVNHPHEEHLIPLHVIVGAAGADRADWVYGWPSQFQEYVDVTTTNGQHIAPCLPHGSIIYVSIWSIGTFFSQVYPHLINNFVLITGEGDVVSPDIAYLERADSKIIHWFGQNGNIDASRSKKFTHIPIGIQCYEMSEAIRDIYKQQNHHKLPPIYGDIDEPSHYIQPIDMTHRALNQKHNLHGKNLLLINFHLATDGTGLRRRIWTKMCPKKNRVPFATCLKKTSGVDMSHLSYIYSRNREYAFWLSPRGNGIDCHRTWEALYLDAIPIVWNSSLNILYEDLPVIIIQNDTEITETFLREKLHEISMKKYHQMNQVYRFEKLRNAYWRRLILSKSRHSLTNNNIRINQCWRARTSTKYFPLSWLF